MVDKTKNTKKNNNQDDKIVSPTQDQMDKWVEQELAEAEQDDMLSKKDSTETLFEEEPAE